MTTRMCGAGQNGQHRLDTRLAGVPPPRGSARVERKALKGDAMDCTMGNCAVGQPWLDVVTSSAFWRETCLV